MKTTMSEMLPAGIMLLAVCSVVGAAELREGIASPRSLPTDTLPPFGMLDDSGRLIPVPDPKGLAAFAAPMPAGAPAIAKAPTPKPLSLELATEAVRATLETCSKLGFPIAAAVVDAQGKPVVMMADPATDGSVYVAARKASAAIEYRVPSSKVGATIQGNPDMLARMTPVMFIAGGAVPVWRGNDLIGAIAASGAKGQGPIGTQDEACAKAGLDSIAARLR
jgi:uncharacterized protein GlcG (DUF336 family)